MKTAFTLRLGPFKTLVNVHDAYASPNDAKVSKFVDTQDGTIKALKSQISSRVIGSTPSLRFIHSLSSTSFLKSTAVNWSAYDGSSSPTSKTSYYTNMPNAGDAGKARMHLNGVDYQLGMTAPPTGMTATGAATCSYQVTFFCMATGIESNPSPRVTGAKGATLGSIPKYTDPNDPARHTTVRRRIYRTRENDPNGILYYLQEIQDNTSTSVTALPDVSGLALDWGAGGNINSDILSSDHSPAPSLNVMSDNIHSVTGGQGATGMGILFGAVGNWLAWSASGNPSYWPTENWLKMPDPINAIVTWNSQTFVLTESSIYSISGTADYALSIVKTGASTGVSKLHAKTTSQTPHGIIFMSKNGVVIFDGSSVNLLSDPYLEQTKLSESLTPYACGAYFGGFYFLSSSDYSDESGNGLIYVFDMRRFPDVRVTEANYAATAFAAIPGGLYFAERYGDICEWVPITGSGEKSWLWETPRLYLDEPEKLKRFLRASASTEGEVKLSFFIDDDIEPRFVKEKASGLFWVASSLQGRSLRVRAEGAPGSRLVSLELRGEVLRA